MSLMSLVPAVLFQERLPRTHSTIVINWKRQQCSVGKDSATNTFACLASSRWTNSSTESRKSETVVVNGLARKRSANVGRLMAWRGSDSVCLKASFRQRERSTASDTLISQKSVCSIKRQLGYFLCFSASWRRCKPSLERTQTNKARWCRLMQMATGAIIMVKKEMKRGSSAVCAFF